MPLILRPLTAAAILVLALLSPGLADSQTSSVPSADQLAIFQSLTPEQQDAILRQIGGAASGSNPTLGERAGQQPGQRQGQETEQNPALQKFQNLAQPEETENPPGPPRLKGDDWVIIEIDYHLPPRPLAQTLQSLQSLSVTQGLSASQIAALQSSGQTQLPPAVVSAAAAANLTPEAGGPQPLNASQRAYLDDMMKLIRAQNPYQLSSDGALSLPGFPPIQLAGLTDDEATLRLKAEPAFAALDIRLTRLPLKKIGKKGLKPFGYDLFDKPPSTFAPATNVPVPADYVIGAGDQLDVQLYGNQNRSFRLTVGRDGVINFPQLGPIHVGGQLFDSAKAGIEGRVARELIGVHASVSMGDTRSIRVFVLGEARRPGSYTVSGLATITSALFAAGGVKQIGSLRNVELKRQGRLVRRLDMYDMLIRGDSSDDSQLLPGDVIFIPPVGPTVAAEGEIRRPAIYEIKNEATLEDVIELAGGLTPEADRSRVTLTRIDTSQHRVVVQVDLSSAEGGKQAVRDGDLLRFAQLRPTLDSGIVVQGHLYTPGAIAYHEGIRLSEVIHSVDELMPNADIHYLLIRREVPPNRRIAVLSADLAAALGAPGSKADVLLMPRDRITVFDLASGRDQIIRPLMDELQVQSNQAQPTQLVHVDGLVKVPGDYPLETGMTVSDLVRAGGGLADAAYSAKAELTRYEVINGESRRTELVNVDLAAALHGEASANLKLQPFDDLSIKEVSEWRGQEAVTLKGEVRFPGRYSIRRGESLRSVIARAGGLTDFAFVDGAVFTREELKRREQEQLDMLATRMQRDLAILALQSTATSQNAAAGAAAAGGALSIGQQLFAQLRNVRAVGRLVIDLRRVMSAPAGSSTDLILRNNDELIVPRLQQEVTVIGEVQTTTSHLYSAELTRDDYIAMSGGTTRRADHKNIYVVRANGSVVARQGSRWFQDGQIHMKPGDTVVVPLDAERLPSLLYWQAVTSILYNIAIAVAAIHGL